MTSYDTNLVNPPLPRILPCVCGGLVEDHDVDGACSCVRCSRRLGGLGCVEYREAAACDCGAMPWQRCSCDDGRDE